MRAACRKSVKRSSTLIPSRTHTLVFLGFSAASVLLPRRAKAFTCALAGRSLVLLSTSRRCLLPYVVCVDYAFRVLACQLRVLLCAQPRDIISSSCCSNFLVQRTAILGNPRSTYQKLFDWIASSVRAVALVCDISIAAQFACKCFCSPKTPVFACLPQKLDAENLKQCMSFTWHKLFGRGWRNWQIDPNLLCPNKPSTCAHTEHVYAIC